jgi:RTA1 like protein
MFYANTVFLTGWILRVVSSHHPSNLGLYIAQTIFIYAGPPIYAAAEYNILGRLMHYLPMHTPLHPRRVVIFFIYLGALVEALTGAGAGKLASATLGTDRYLSGGRMIAVATVLQAVVEVVFMSLVALLHRRAVKSQMLAKNVKVVCIMLYVNSTLVLLRCVFRAVEAFSTYMRDCGGIHCGTVARHEWYMYALEAAPMVVFTFWLNVAHPGRFLPSERKRYLDVDGRTERMGPGWIDQRPYWMTFVDPFNLGKDSRGGQKFWLSPQKWKICEDGSFATSSASNRTKRKDSAV